MFEYPFCYLGDYCGDSGEPPVGPRCRQAAHDLFHLCFDEWLGWTQRHFGTIGQCWEWFFFGLLLGSIPLVLLLNLWCCLRRPCGGRTVQTRLAIDVSVKDPGQSVSVHTPLPDLPVPAAPASSVILDSPLELPSSPRRRLISSATGGSSEIEEPSFPALRVTPKRRVKQDGQ